MKRLTALAIAASLLAVGLTTVASPTTPAAAHSDSAYSNEDFTGVRLDRWMTPLPGELKLSELSIPGTHDTGSYAFGGDIALTQSMTIEAQLVAGIRALDLRVGVEPVQGCIEPHLFHGPICQRGVTFAATVAVMKKFLQAYPGETIVARLTKEHGEPDWASIKSQLQDIVYMGESKNPTLDAIRGKVVLLVENFPALGHMKWKDPDTQVWQDKYDLNDNWDLARKWLYVRPYLDRADRVRSKPETRDTIYINHLSAAEGGFPYFYASGHSSPQTGAPRLLTGWTSGAIDTCSDTAKCLPEYPRVNCVSFFGLSGTETCSVAFEGINTLATNYIANHVEDRTGIVMIDFPGAGLIQSIVRLNPWRTPLPIELVTDRDAAGEGGQGIRLMDRTESAGGANTYRYDLDADGTFEVGPLPTSIYTFTRGDDYEGLVVMEKTDGVQTVTDTARVRFDNLIPEFQDPVRTYYEVDEGESFAIEGVVRDRGTDQLTMSLQTPLRFSYGELPLSNSKCPTPYAAYFCHPFSITDFFPDNQTIDYTLTVTDDDGGAQSLSGRIAVRNVAPTVGTPRLATTAGTQIGEGDRIDPNTALRLSVDWSDVPADTHSANINWGDGSEEVVLKPGSPLSLTHTYTTATTAGSRQVVVTVRDDDGGTTTVYSPTFRVGALPPPPIAKPTADGGGPYSAPEGSTVRLDASSSTVDPSRTAQAQYRWDFDGDGSWDTPRTTSPAAEWRGPVPTRPDDFATTRARLEVFDGSTAVIDDAISIAFRNAAPTVTTEVAEAEEGGVSRVTVTVDDPGWDSHILQIDWNDDELEDDQRSLAPQAGSSSWSFSWRFADEGSYPVRIWVIDDNGAVVSRLVQAPVTNVSPTAFIQSLTFSESDRVPAEPPASADAVAVDGLVTLRADWSDPGAADRHRVSIDWGDGTETERTDVTARSIVETHRYTSVGDRVVQLQVSDNDGGQSEVVSRPIRVAEAAVPSGADFTPIDPQRLTDTRTGTGAGILPAGQELRVKVAGTAGIPGDAAAAALNVTVTGPRAGGWLRVYPCGGTVPETSNLNYTRNQTVPNAVLTGIGTNGEVCIAGSATTHVVVDAMGWYP